MRITFVTDLGNSYPVEIDPQMETEDIMALLEAESGIPITEQVLSFEGRVLNNPKATIHDYGIREDALLLLERRVLVAERSGEQDTEMMRLRLLGDPNLMQQLSGVHPELVHAAQNNPVRFAELLRQIHARQQEAEQMEIEALNADPFNEEAQRRIEAVLENMEHALEYSPETFGQVTMLYINVEVNDEPMVAFVDSGAQRSIMSLEYAEKCGIKRLIDDRCSGIARGVGTAKIFGRVYAAQMKLGNIYLPCSYLIMEGRDIDLVIGLDMLKSFQACIDLKKNVLRIHGEEIPFLAEHELPEKAKMGFDSQGEVIRMEPTPQSSQPPAGSSSQRFQGLGSTLGSTPTPVQSPRLQFPEETIQTLIGLGATREQAMECLARAGGNVDMAASLLFN